MGRITMWTKDQQALADEEAARRASVLAEVGDELEQATRKFGPFASPHEGWAIIKEEMDELWDAIKTGQPMADMRQEAIQVAAMAVRFVVNMEAGWLHDTQHGNTSTRS